MFIFAENGNSVLLWHRPPKSTYPTYLRYLYSLEGPIALSIENAICPSSRTVLANVMRTLTQMMRFLNTMKSYVSTKSTVLKYALVSYLTIRTRETIVSSFLSKSTYRDISLKDKDRTYRISAGQEFQVIHTCVTSSPR